MNDSPEGASRLWPLDWRLLARKDVLAGLLFIAVAVLGLWLSRAYPIGTTLRMGTGYVPRLLCWILLGLGLVVLVQGLRARPTETVAPDPFWQPLALVPAALVTFAFTIERLGVVLATLLLVGVGSLASRDKRVVELLLAALVLLVLTLAIFIWGLGLPIPVWPEW